MCGEPGFSLSLDLLSDQPLLFLQLPRALLSQTDDLDTGAHAHASCGQRIQNGYGPHAACKLACTGTRTALT